mgnify:FL=1
MKHWELYSHALSNAHEPDLKKLPSAKGIWAPCLTYCETEDLFYVVYGTITILQQGQRIRGYIKPQNFKSLPQSRISLKKRKK